MSTKKKQAKTCLLAFGIFKEKVESIYRSIKFSRVQRKIVLDSLTLKHCKFTILFVVWYFTVSNSLFGGVKTEWGTPVLPEYCLTVTSLLESKYLVTHPLYLIFLWLIISFSWSTISCKFCFTIQTDLCLYREKAIAKRCYRTLECCKTL